MRKTALLALLLTACQPPQQIHITGKIEPQSTGFLGLTIKNKITISFNGYEVMTGYLDKQNNTDLVGMFENNPVSAKCSGAEKINCLISHNNTTTQLTFE